MHLNPYGEYAVLLAGSLANGWPTDRAGIVDRTRQYGMTMQFPSHPNDWEKCRTVIDRWLRVVDTPDPQTRAELLNADLAAASAYPRLTDHNGEGWHLHYRDADQSLPHVLAAVISVGTALHLTTRGMHRIARCAASTTTHTPCNKVVVDVTRNGRQRYCSVQCANRSAVRRHREKTARSRKT
ncbi:CGNR zinc finger domain-containing protein [Jonesia quinghaiensis]|uniref:CGNR zinc finger domain-containing protein n=1 Tax=Jonesia quinghaiensis TaxID=262806 RepID=UPI000427EFB8|nr:CGNR zinc finger domain-containing protein [Jonesia quinghaiensis]